MTPTLLLPMALSDTAVVSIAGIAVSGLLGPAAASLWARRQQRREHLHDRGLKRFDDLVDLLDRSAELLAPGTSHVRAAFEAAQRGDPEAADICDWASEVHVAYERILLRLPKDDPVSQAYRTAQKRLATLGDVIDEAAAQARGRPCPSKGE